MTITLTGYHDRTDPAKNYERHLFRSDHALQAAELNEIQTAAAARLQALSDTLLDEGAILSGGDCRTAVAGDACTCTCDAGAIYLRGAVRGVLPRTFAIPATGRFAVGVYLVDAVVTELQDPALRDPGISPLNNQEPGAARLQATPSWGYAGDGRPGAFYPVHDVENGVLLTKAEPPQVSAIALNIARYDRQSTGGYYVSSGLKVARLADSGGRQVYSMAEGAARVQGAEIVRQHARRFEVDAVPDLRSVAMETHTVPATGTLGDDYTVTFNHGPVKSIGSISVIREVTHSLTHGTAGGKDELPLTPAVEIVRVSSDAAGLSPYAVGTYALDGDSRIDWSPTGAEPGSGATYYIVYRYWDTVPSATLTDVSEAAATIPGTVTATVRTGVTAAAKLVRGTASYSSYAWAMPRYDLICLDALGEIVHVPGVAAATSPRVPPTPDGLLRVATVAQRWDATTAVTQTGVRMVSMSELNTIGRRIETLFALVAEERLALNLTQRDNSAKKGVFADPLLDDDLRDQGLPQTAAIVSGTLQLGVTAVAHQQSLSEPGVLQRQATLGDEVVSISQPRRTATMRVNPYDSFAPLPGVAILEPGTDLWTEFQTNWLSPVTQRFDESIWTNPATRDWGMSLYSTVGAKQGMTAEAWVNAHTTVVNDMGSVDSADVEKVGTRYADLQLLRPITVRFTLSGFGAGELLNAVRFDGKDVAFEEAPL